MEPSGSTSRSTAWRLRTRLASGIVALVPVVVTVWVLRFVFNFTAGILLPLVEPWLGTWPPAVQAGLSFAILLTGVYLLGEIATNLVGRRVLSLGESLVLRVPLVKVVYSVTKQVVAAFENRQGRAFKSVVLVEFPQTGLRSVGFVTSRITSPDGVAWTTVFIPTTPNPTTGFLHVVREADLVTTEYTVEEGIKMVMSLGVMIPPSGIPAGA